MKEKLTVTLNQWNEILRNEMSISADLRNQEKCNQASAMKFKIEKMIMDL